MDLSQYKKHIDLVWTIANLLRGPYRPPQYRRMMIPLTVLRRLDCVLEDSKKQVMKRYSALKSAGKYDDETIEKIIKKNSISIFSISAGLPLKNIFDTEVLQEGRVVRKYLTTAADGQLVQ